jgi:hypothetical protein
MDVDVVIASVKTNETRSGNTRWSVKDDEGREYTTFRPAIGRAAEAAEGRRARISYHEDERNGFRNVYLDGVQPLRERAASAGADTGSGGPSDSDPEEAAWRTAVEAAPYLLGDEGRDGEVAPEEAFEKLKPFKDLVSEDIRSGPSESSDRGD